MDIKQELKYVINEYKNNRYCTGETNISLMGEACLKEIERLEDELKACETKGSVEMTTNVDSYSCNWCRRLYRNDWEAHRCAFNHAKFNYANSLLKDGRELKHINDMCGFNWDLTKEQENITKDNCFIMPDWQCCYKPAYQIVEVAEWGSVKLWGKGNWSGSYEEYISIDKLPKPFPKEDLFVYEKRKRY